MADLEAKEAKWAIKKNNNCGKSYIKVYYKTCIVSLTLDLQFVVTCMVRDSKMSSQMLSS